MEPIETVPFSSLIAGMLLKTRELSTTDIVNMISKLSDYNIHVEDEEDDLDYLGLCVEIGPNYRFSLKKDMNYDTKLDDNITVYMFLLNIAGPVLLSFLGLDCASEFIEEEHINKEEVEKVSYNFLTRVKIRVRNRRNKLNNGNNLNKIIV
ncbi:MAG: hypothetical protein IJ509_01735 [Bacilli bacterium]|nr:hypothetical protein [Bacilli bacterium]